MKKKTNYKTYLARFTIMDGEHEHTAYGLIKADTLDDAKEYAESQEHDAEFCRDAEVVTFFDYGDGTTASKCDNVIELDQNQVDVIEELGLAYYMN
jgi:hypothetical protein